MNLHRPTNGGKGSLGHSQPADFTGVDKFTHGPNRVLDGDIRIDPMLVVQVDDLNPEPQQTAIASGLHIFRMAVDANEFPLFITDIAELGRQENFSAAAFDGLADEALVLAAAVHVGRVEKVEAEIEGAVDGGNGFGVVLRSVEVGHAHATEPKGRNLWAVFPKHSSLHSG